MKEENSKKKKSVFLRLLKRVKPSRLIFLAVLLAVNTYAWFIYVNTVSNSVDVHVKSWKIDFTSGDTPITDYVNVFVDNAISNRSEFLEYCNQEGIKLYYLKAEDVNTTYAGIIKYIDESYKLRKKGK